MSSAESQKRQITPDDVASARAVDPVALAAKYLKLEKRGHAYFAICPFHKEGRPSFKAEAGRKYHCFPCGAHLDTIEFVQRMENIDFLEAVARLISADAPPPRLRIISRTERPVDLMTDPKVREARAVWHSAQRCA